MSSRLTAITLNYSSRGIQCTFHTQCAQCGHMVALALAENCSFQHALENIFQRLQPVKDVMRNHLSQRNIM